MKVVELSQEDWLTLSEDVHRTVFGESGYAALERASKALLVDLDGTPICYCTIKEDDAVTAYMQWGGAFPSSKGTALSFRGYEMMIAHLKGRYKFIRTLIENSNVSMLKFAMKVGFRVHGIRYFSGSILLEHLIKQEE